MKKTTQSFLLIASLLVSNVYAAVCTVNNGLIAPPNANIQLNGVAGVPGLVIGVGNPNCQVAPCNLNQNTGVAYVNGVAATLPANTSQLNAVSVASTNYAVAVGENKNNMPVALVQFNGTTWTAMPLTGSPPTQDVYGVKTYGPNQTYAVGNDGMFFFNGTTWTRQLAIGNVPKVGGQKAGKFVGMWGNATTVYALADNGALYSKSAATPPTAWVQGPNPPAALNNANFNGISGDAAGNVYITGQDNNNNGFVYQFNPVTNTWSNLITTATQFDMKAIAINPVNGAITAVGDKGAQLVSGPNGTGPWTQTAPVNNTNDINGVYIAPNGTTYLAGQTAAGCTLPVTGPDHIEIQHAGSGLTCSPATITVRACADATCAALYTGGGVTVTPSPAGVPVTIGTSGFATTTVQQSTAGGATLSATSNPASAFATACLNTTTNAVSCAMTFNNAGFVITIPNHTACANTTATIEAVQTGGTGRCVPAYQNVTRPVNLFSSYVNPTTGTQVITASTGGVSTTAPGTAHSLAFDATGKATITLSYPDAGQLTLTANDTAPTGAAMTGGGSFIAAPASFVFSGIPAAPLTAGSPFNATLKAMNACAIPAVTPNFNGTVMIASMNPLPALGNATAINTPAAAFTGGVSNTNLTWNEVGTIDLNGSMNSYLGWTLPAVVTGTQASVGRFHPAYFVTTATPACSGAFSYAGSTSPAKAGQPFSVTATAYAAAGNVTKNYAGAYAYITTLSNAGVATGFAANTIAAASFANGVGTANAVTYAVATPQTAPVTLTLRATDVDTPVVSSVGHEATMSVRSGRVHLVNAYGSELQSMPIPFTAEYYTGNQWVVNSLDSCTVATLPALTLQPSGVTVTRTFNSPFASGQGNLQLSAPNATGEVTISPVVDTWLQYVWTGTTLRNPTARATFGVYKGNNTFIYRGRRGR